MEITNNIEDMAISEIKALKRLEIKVNFTQQPYNVLETERLGTPAYNFDWDIAKTLVLKDTLPIALSIPVYNGDSEVSHRSISVNVSPIVVRIDKGLSFDEPNTYQIRLTGELNSTLITIDLISFVIEHTIDYTKPLILKYSEKETASFESKNYKEKPELVYGFCKRPQIEYKHFRYFDELIEKAKQADNNPCSKFPVSIEEMEGYLYPIFFKALVKYNFAKNKRYTNLFAFDDDFIWRNNNGNMFSLFIINDNDGVEAFLQAFSELYQYIDVESTKATIYSLNKRLYDLMNFDDLERNLRDIGVARTQNIFDRVNRKLTAPYLAQSCKT